MVQFNGSVSIKTTRNVCRSNTAVLSLLNHMPKNPSTFFLNLLWNIFNVLLLHHENKCCRQFIVMGANLEGYF